MNKVALAFLSKDKVELTKQTIQSLLQPDKFDLWWIDGSATAIGQDFPCNYGTGNFEFRDNIRGGPDAAVAYALSTLLDHRAPNIDGNQYTHVGIVESDVLLHPDWFAPTFELFHRGESEGLAVGAVSARAYEDRILFQRDGYCVAHNLGWGMQIMTREAAELALSHFRTHWRSENRNVFAHLAGLDIGRWWAWRAEDGCTCADWGNDRILAAHGLASLALTPSPVQMIGQTPPLHEQGLTLVEHPVELLRNDRLFTTFCERTAAIRAGTATSINNKFLRESDGGTIYFAHQVRALGAVFSGSWSLKWSQGIGPFGWRAAQPPDSFPIAGSVTIPVLGPCSFICQGGPTGGQILAEDLDSGYECSPVLRPESTNTVTTINMPAGFSYRQVRLTALTPGVTFFGLRTIQPQPIADTSYTFRHSHLPPVE